MSSSRSLRVEAVLVSLSIGCLGLYFLFKALGLHTLSYICLGGQGVFVGLQMSGVSYWIHKIRLKRTKKDAAAWDDIIKDVGVETANDDMWKDRLIYRPGRTFAVTTYFSDGEAMTRIAPSYFKKFSAALADLSCFDKNAASVPHRIWVYYPVMREYFKVQNFGKSMPGGTRNGQTQTWIDEENDDRLVP